MFYRKHDHELKETHFNKLDAIQNPAQREAKTVLKF